jgi:hypothetical protein
MEAYDVNGLEDAGGPDGEKLQLIDERPYALLSVDDHHHDGQFVGDPQKMALVDLPGRSVSLESPEDRGAGEV